ncbi:MAG: hypothetical protein K9J25_12995, partial [Bacteroidales bacterium]|nr:hypothetical protein [Bacteroidales bacterium]
MSYSQEVGDYRTVGDADFNSPTNWQRFNGGGWAAAGNDPNLGAETIFIRAGHTATLSVSETLDQLIVESGGILSINSGSTLTLNNGTGTDLDVSGTVNNSGIINSPGALIIFNAAAVYNHQRDGGVIPTAIWDVDSDCNITGVTNTIPSGFNQTFGNFTWNCPGHNANLYMESDMTVAGNMTVSGTGAYNPNFRALRMSNTATGYTINVLGDLVIDNDASFKMNNNSGSCTMNVSGDFFLNSGSYCIVTGPASSDFNVAGSVTISGGVVIMHEDFSSTTASFNVDGDFSFTNGTITDNASGTCEINFTGSGLQTYLKSGGNYQNTIDFSVASGSILDVGTSLIDGSNGTFNLNSGAGIITANTEGLSSTFGLGSIQVTGTKTFSTGADYTYDGASLQITGNALPATVNDLTINNSSNISLTNSVSVNSDLSLTAGNLIIGTNDISINSGGQIIGGSALSYIVAVSSGVLRHEVPSSDILFPIGLSASYTPITLNNSGTIDNYGIRVFQDVLTNGTSGTTVAEIDESVNITWVLTEGIAGESDLIVTPQWNGSDEGISFDRAFSCIGFHNGSSWSKQDPAAAVGSDPYTAVRSGITGPGAIVVGGPCTRFGNDNQDPSITCATPAASYNADAGECYYTVPDNGLDPVSTDDNCGVASV